ncbi:glycosyltransferase [Tamlana haliotis]|uniref:Glycosyltransferase n=1 Tax=Pseudotamlana haliotis TaxID=2614804 RepID=A0A6N6MDS0_9FLAO|nr:glycosyltransferase [Tamlana haliotis]KAB1067853.1 glycosyltransferase [Tamlana haliotis]
MSNSKKNILFFTDWFLPAYKAGGPIQSVANLTNHLKETFNIWVVTSNSDLDAELVLPPTELNTWIAKDGYHVIYLNKDHQNKNTYRSILNEIPVHAIYFNSLFSLNFTLIPLWLTRNSSIKKVMAPRGMLGKGALAIKPTKKKFFLKLFKAFKLPNKLQWHATDISEKNEIIQHFGKRVKIDVVPNLSAKMTDLVPVKTKVENSINLFFLSRISVKKNLLSAIKSLEQATCSINFKIIGPIEEINYWEDCLKTLNKLPKNIHFEYLGAIPNMQIKDTLRDLHVLLLPTQHENFGHVIMESWQNGCPVIISKNTPWKNLKTEKLGFDLNLEQIDDFTKAILFFAKMNEKEFQSWSQASFSFAKKFTENPELINQSKALFE